MQPLKSGKFSAWNLVKLNCWNYEGKEGGKVQKEREKVDKEVKETERATGEMEMDRKTQNICQSLL